MVNNPPVAAVQGNIEVKLDRIAAFDNVVGERRCFKYRENQGLQGFSHHSPPFTRSADVGSPLLSIVGLACARPITSFINCYFYYLPNALSDTLWKVVPSILHAEKLSVILFWLTIRTCG
jgi:hypothetical protein